MNLETANKLLALRKKNNLSQEDLAEKLGVSRQAISKWERGETSPDTDNLISLANLYRISLDELLDIDVKTFKSDYVPPLDNDDMSHKTIKLTKSEDDEFNYFNSKRVVYPKGSLQEEVYPQKNNDEPPHEFKSAISDIENNFSQTYKQSNPIVVVPQPEDKSKKKSKHKGFFRKNKDKNKSNIPKFTNNRFINWFEDKMKKFNISYKGLYTFPIYAIGIALGILFSETCGYYGNYLAGASVLGIPLYYTFITAIKKRNANYFGYPILALILVLLSMGFFNGEELSALWLATIPFYYWFINKDK